MKFKYSVITDEPNQGLYFALTKGDLLGLDSLEEYFGIPDGHITQSTREAIKSRMNELKEGQMLLIEKKE